MKLFSRKLVDFIRATYSTNDYIPLHAPIFGSKEKEYVLDAIDSTFVSTVGSYVTAFEKSVARYTGSKFAIATVNGTSALHSALIASKVQLNDEVITQSLAFVAAANAIRYCGAHPIFVDVAKDTMGMSPTSLMQFLHDFAELRDDGLCWNKKTKRIIRACIPVHCLGHPAEVDKIQELCDLYNIKLIKRG